MRILVGTSGYSYAPWKGTFYPAKLPASKMLAHYAGQLATVEINNTFYRMPKPLLISKWADEVPPGFRFAIKSPRRITHEKRLVDTAEPLRQFVDVVGVLGERLGPLLFQLPPFLKKDLPRLQGFLADLRATSVQVRAAFEFRHPSWFDAEVYDTLRGAGAALCISESEDLATPLEPTAPFGYLRLRRQDYENDQITSWAHKIRRQPWDEVYVFFKHEDEGKGPQLAARLVADLAASGP